MTDLITPPIANLTERLDANPEGDLFDLFLGWTADRGLELYEAQEEAMLEVFSDNHVILNTPTGSGKSLVGLAMHFYSFAQGKRSYYTSPIKALVSEKFFALCEHFGAEHVGMLTGDASINHDAPIICCTQEILSAIALGEGTKANVQHAVIDEFHYYADRERGSAWQLPLLMLPQTAFLLMSATLGDTTRLQEQLEERTGRPVALVKSDQRPVPLSYEYSKDKVVHLVTDLVNKGRAPLYIVNFTQRDCAELAQSLMSVNYCTSDEKKAIVDALKGTSFDTPYGQTVRRYLKHGIAIHHGGLLPKYRFLAEKLSQQGLLKIIVGTDTLGVGINMPLRTVLFTKLCKYDGLKTRLLSVREFKQIAGRAGRRGFDTEGTVIAQAPEHVIENESATSKVSGNPKKLKKLKLKAAPTKRYAHWDENTFERLHTSDSEPLDSKFSIDHSTLLYLLQRPDVGHQGYDDLLALIELSHETDGRKQILKEKARMLLESLEHAGIVSIDYGEDGVEVKVSGELQDDFTVHHGLSLFLVEVVDGMDQEGATSHMTLLSFVEAILENPNVVLMRQRDKMRDAEYKRLKAEDVEYEKLKELLEKVTWPQPDAPLIQQAFEAFGQVHPWVLGFEPRPKSVARDMFERWASFNQYVKEYELERSEGVLLRYLNQVYKALRQNIPDADKSPQVHEIIAYLREIIARADSSLVEEWESLRFGDDAPERAAIEVSLDDDLPAFRARIHAELMQIIAACAEDDLEEAAALLRPSGEGWGPMDLEDALKPFLSEYEKLVFNHSARARALTTFEKKGMGLWRVVQVLCDPEGHNEWYIEGTVNLKTLKSNEDRLFALDKISN